MLLYETTNNKSVSQMTISIDDDEIQMALEYLSYQQGLLDIEPESISDIRFNNLKNKLLKRRYKFGTLKGTGTVYTLPTRGTYQKLLVNTKKDDTLIINPNCFVAASNNIKLTMQYEINVTKILGGRKFNEVLLDGAGSVVLHAQGPIVELDLNNEKFLAYNNTVLAHSSKLNISRHKPEFSSAFIKTYSGTGKIYFVPLPNILDKKND